MYSLRDQCSFLQFETRKPGISRGISRLDLETDKTK